jgi:protein O-mannosyl-transferase
VWTASIILAGAVWSVYANSLSAPFIFDDTSSIQENPTIRRLWPPWQALSPPRNGSGVDGRPVLNFSFAINYALHGTDVRGYHVGNTLIHAVAALLLFGFVRRMVAGGAHVPETLRRSALPIAFFVALLWAVHPLQTESVTCVVQRTESLSGCVYLATLYLFARGVRSEGNTSRAWLTASAFACLFGMATKETVATAPLVVLLADRTFAAGTFREALRRRAVYHAALVATWIPLAALMTGSAWRGGSVGFSHGIGPWLSLLTQCKAVVMYLGLSFWPHPLVVDYGTEVIEKLREVLPQAILLTSLAAATVWALVRRPALGFLGAWFFVILAPSSSFVPLLTQTMAEHRMYLPLAAVMALVVAGLFALGRARRGATVAAGLVCAGAAIALGFGTIRRNDDYATVVGLWTDTVRACPDNARAHYNLGLALSRVGDDPGAARCYREALRLLPAFGDAHLNLGSLLFAEGRFEEARVHYEEGLRLKPRSAVAHNNMGNALALEGDAAGALRHYEEAVRLDPDYGEAWNNLGYALSTGGSVDEAIAPLRKAIALRPTLAEAHANLGKALVALGRLDEAGRCFVEALRLRPVHPGAHAGLAHVLFEAGRYADALSHYEAAARLEPGNSDCHYNIGVTLVRLGRPRDAVGAFEEALRLSPGEPAASAALAALREMLARRATPP